MRRNRIGVMLGALAAAALVIVLGARGVVADGPPRTLLLTLRSDASLDAGQQLLEANGAHVLERLRPLPVLRATIPANADADVLLGALRASPLARGAELEDEQSVQVVPNDQLYRAYQWNLRRIAMEQVWDLRPS
ncbi:MAG TPA: hypothetical protein VK898_21570, partial [Chloroflexota bacterium]|nr:hypothetical protein [Chloroflexota bacterium]